MNYGYFTWWQIIVMHKSQGVLNGLITRHANNQEKLKEIMKGKTEKQIRLARSHLRTVLDLKKGGKK